MATAAKRRTEYRNYRRVGFDAEEAAEAAPLVDPETGEVIEAL